MVVVLTLEDGREERDEPFGREDPPAPYVGRDDIVAVVIFPKADYLYYTISTLAFSGCQSLTSVTIHVGVSGIDANAFEACKSLASVIFPEGLGYIGRRAFRGCESLASVSFPNGLEVIAEEAFFGCKSLASVSFPNGLEEIGDKAFEGCKSLASVIFPEGLEYIGRRAFRGCESLASVSFHNGLEEIGRDVFYGCTHLVSIVMAEASLDVEQLSQIFATCARLALLVAPQATIEALPSPTTRPALLTNAMLGLALDDFPNVTMALSPGAVQLAERWNPQTHVLATPEQRNWVKFALLLLIRRLGLPHVAAVAVLQTMKRSDLGDARAIGW